MNVELLAERIAEQIANSVDNPNNVQRFTPSVKMGRQYRRKMSCFGIAPLWATTIVARIGPFNCRRDCPLLCIINLH